MAWGLILEVSRGARPWGLLFEPVRRVREQGEPRLHPVVDAADGERPRKHPAEAGREDVNARDPGGDPRAGATGAGHELADRLAHPARLNGFLVLAVACLPGDERIADEARHLVVGQ